MASFHGISTSSGVLNLVQELLAVQLLGPK